MTPSDPEPFDVFLSYHSGDAAWIAQLKTALEARGIRVWLDSEQIRPGDQFPRALANAIGLVRAVVIALSPGSIASPWVEEEYNLALAHRRHVIPVLIGDAEPPGFLKGRTWVDFRDDSRFAEGVDDVVFGITGQRAGKTEAPRPHGFRDAAAVPGGADETEVLKRLIERRRRDARRLQITRALSAAIGAVIGIVFFVVASDTTLQARVVVCVAVPAIVALAGWSVTATGLARLGRKVEQFEVMKDGLEACRSRTHPGCAKLRQHFWDMMLRNASDAGMDVRQVQL